MTTREAARRLGLTPTRVAQLCRKPGETLIRGVKEGRDWIVDPDSVEAELKRRSEAER